MRLKQKARHAWLKMNQANRFKAFICGLSGLKLTEEEVIFLGRERPWGVILFARNISDANQLQTLTRDIKNVFQNQNYPILIDQEGGRVARIAPPLARAHPPAAAYGTLYQLNEKTGLEAAYLGGRIMADDLSAFGINVNCAPCLDVACEETAEIIGNRAFSTDPMAVSALGKEFMLGLLDGGILPVIKHLPGHGRGSVDSHLELPHVDTPQDILEITDFIPFTDNKDAPIAMTGHLLFSQIDAQYVSTCSKKVINKIIRETIGFNGLLMGDDVSMKALSGSLTERATASLDAGCDLILHCNGNLSEMQEIAAIARPLTGLAEERALRASDRLTKAHKPAGLKMEQHWGELLSDIFKPA